MLTQHNKLQEKTLYHRRMFRHAHHSCARKILPFLWLHVRRSTRVIQPTDMPPDPIQTNKTAHWSYYSTNLHHVHTYIRKHAIQWYSMWQYNANVPFCFHSVLWNNSTVLGHIYGPFFIRSTSEWLQNKTIPLAIEWLDTGEMTHTFVDLWNKHS